MLPNTLWYTFEPQFASNHDKKTSSSRSSKVCFDLILAHTVAGESAPPRMARSTLACSASIDLSTRGISAYPIAKSLSSHKTSKDLNLSMNASSCADTKGLPKNLWATLCMWDLFAQPAHSDRHDFATKIAKPGSGFVIPSNL